jgi:hypothetical protein
MKRRRNMHFRKTYDQVLSELGGIDYSKQSEITSPVRLYSSKQGKAGDPLERPRKGKNYAVYFNLNAMRSGLYGLGGVSEKSALFKRVKNSMPPFTDKDGKKVAPHPIQRARTYFGGSIYSFVDPQRGYVVSHQRTAELDDVVFEIHKKVVREIRESGSKTPCCFVEGTYVKPVSGKEQRDYISEWFDNMDGHLELYSDGWRQVVFNPMRSDTFMYYDEEKDQYFPALTAERVVMMSLPIPASQVARRSIPYLILAQYVNEASTYEDTDTYIRRKKRNPMRRKKNTSKPSPRLAHIFSTIEEDEKQLILTRSKDLLDPTYYDVENMRITDEWIAMNMRNNNFIMGRFDPYWEGRDVRKSDIPKLRKMLKGEMDTTSARRSFQSLTRTERDDVAYGNNYGRLADAFGVSRDTIGQWKWKLYHEYGYDGVIFRSQGGQISRVERGKGETERIGWTTHKSAGTYRKYPRTKKFLRKNGRNLGYGTKNGAMLKNQLITVVRVAQELNNAIQYDDEVPDWVLSKATVAMDRLVVANNYIQSKLQGMTPNPRVNVNAAIKNARRVIKEIR